MSEGVHEIHNLESEVWIFKGLYAYKPKPVKNINSLITTINTQISGSQYKPCKTLFVTSLLPKFWERLKAGWDWRGVWEIFQYTLRFAGQFKTDISLGYSGSAFLQTIHIIPEGRVALWEEQRNIVFWWNEI